MLRRMPSISLRDRQLVLQGDDKVLQGGQAGWKIGFVWICEPEQAVGEEIFHSPSIGVLSILPILGGVLSRFWCGNGAQVSVEGAKTPVFATFMSKSAHHFSGVPRLFFGPL